MGNTFVLISLLNESFQSSPRSSKQNSYRPPFRRNRQQKNSNTFRLISVGYITTPNFATGAVRKFRPRTSPNNPSLSCAVLDAVRARTFRGPSANKPERLFIETGTGGQGQRANCALIGWKAEEELRAATVDMDYWFTCFFWVGGS